MEIFEQNLNTPWGNFLIRYYYNVESGSEGGYYEPSSNDLITIEHKYVIAHILNTGEELERLVPEWLEDEISIAEITQDIHKSLGWIWRMYLYWSNGRSWGIPV